MIVDYLNILLATEQLIEQLKPTTHALETSSGKVTLFRVIH
jgi:hypothetical protein